MAKNRSRRRGPVSRPAVRPLAALPDAGCCVDEMSHLPSNLLSLQPLLGSLPVSMRATGSHTRLGRLIVATATRTRRVRKLRRVSTPGSLPPPGCGLSGSRRPDHRCRTRRCAWWRAMPRPHPCCQIRGRRTPGWGRLPVATLDSYGRRTARGRQDRCRKRASRNQSREQGVRCAGLSMEFLRMGQGWPAGRRRQSACSSASPPQPPSAYEMISGGPRSGFLGLTFASVEGSHWLSQPGTAACRMPAPPRFHRSFASS